VSGDVLSVAESTSVSLQPALIRRWTERVTDGNSEPRGAPGTEFKVVMNQVEVRFRADEEVPE